MTGNESSKTDQAQKPLHEQDPGRTGGRVFHRAAPATLLLGFVIVTALLLVTPSGDRESPDVATVIAQPAPVSLPATPEPPALSPQALEDLRADPAADQLINPEPLLLEPLPEETVDVTGVDEPADASPEVPDEPFSVGEALARYLLAIRNELNSEFVANCIRFRNRNGAGAECPSDPAFTAGNFDQERALVDELFAIITREGEQARISRRLESENATLAAILDDPDNPAALQAGTKLALNNAYLAYLNGNPSPAVAAFETMNDFINDYNRTIMAGPTQFRCQGGPCVYEFTETPAQ